MEKSKENIQLSKENIPLLEFLKSSKFILYVAIFTVIFLAPNTYYVYYSFCVFIFPYAEIASAGVSLIVAASIMIYTLRKNYKVAKYYSWFEVSISAYYYISTIGLDWGLVPALSFTVMLPVSVYHYTKEIEVGISGGNAEQNIYSFLDRNPDKRPSDFNTGKN